MDFNLSYWKRFLCYFIQYDKMPSHIGIIMDGNRRFASINGISKCDGHQKGSETLERVRMIYYNLIFIRF